MVFTSNISLNLFALLINYVLTSVNQESIAVLKSRFDPLLDKGQYKINDKLKNNNNNYQLCKHEITGEV